ncbi:MAG: PD-(D/E)XK nuclease family protein [Chloroflexota bacterium]|nr:PD-(D/E)XK nuclease family protein [Chloroflexota bacterium]
MSLTVSAHSYGRDAERALIEAVDRLKTESGRPDPLAPVTVVVPTSLAGYRIRRLLGRRPGGVVNVQVKPLRALLELIGSASLANAGRRPLPDSLRAETIREVARNGAPVFGDVPIDGPLLQHLVQRFDEFDELDRSQLDVIAAQSGLPAYLAGLYDAFLERTRDFYTNRDLANSATQALGRELVVLRDIGSVVVYLPGQLNPSQQEFLKELAVQTRVEMLIGLTGDRETVDEHSLAAWNHDAVSEPGEVPSAQRIVQSPDAEEEVRSAIREIAASLIAAEPTPLHRTAILYRQNVPYHRVCAEQLDAAGITWNGRNAQTLGQSIAGRTLSGLIGLMSEPTLSWANDVAPWLAAAPVRDLNGELAPVARWNQLARRANLHRHPQDWQVRLSRYRATCEVDLERLRRVGDESKPGRLLWVEAEIRELGDFSDFAARLARFAVETPERAIWSTYASRVQGQLQLLLGDRSGFAVQMSDEDDVELARWDDVQQLLTELSWLDDLEEATPDRFASAARRGLQRPTGHHRRFGDGVYVGPLSSAVGLQWDVVYILGAAEKSLPQPRSDDPLLSERLRVSAALPVAADQLRRERADYLIALHSADRRVLSYPRADTRAQQARLPGRWLLESATELNAGERIYASKIDRAPSRVVAAIPSFEGALLGSETPADLHEFDLRRIRLAPQPLNHYLAREIQSLGRGLIQRRERWRPLLTRWDGLIAEGAAAAVSVPHSPGALQDWATCPYRYFLGRVLRIEERDDARDELQISALDKGSLMHDILDQFFRQTESHPSPGERWPRSERQRLETIAIEMLDEARQRGLTGHDLLWRRDRQEILNDLETLLARDDEHRAREHTRQVASELVFGRLPDSQAEVELVLAEGGSLQLRGMIDRVDQSTTDDRFIVIDYKTGREFPTASDLRQDPLVGGRVLQLPVYALAARQVYDLDPTATVSSAYWFITDRAGFKYNRVDWDEEHTQQFEQAVNLVVKNIRLGRFPANPGADDHRERTSNCRFCSFDPVCPVDRSARWKQSRQDPRLADYMALSGEASEETDGA